MENLETTIRRHLVSYLAGELSLNEFTDWLIGATWYISNEESAEARDLADSIELALAEASDELLSRDELRAEFQSLLSRVNMNLVRPHEMSPIAGVMVQRGSSTHTITRPLVGDRRITGVTPGLGLRSAQTQLAVAPA